MRYDMKKLLCERPRVHDSCESPTHRRQKHSDIESLPFRQSMSRRRYGTKELNEYLAPLRRYIEKQVGRPWNKVYSEICDHINGGNPVETHILEHIDGYISIKVQRAPTSESNTGLISHGGVNPSWTWRRPVNAGKLYVDPDDGIIKRAKSLVKEKKVVKENVIRKIDDKHLAIKDKGVWYICELARYKVEEQWYWFPNVEMSDRITTNRNYKHGYSVKVYIINGTQYRHIPHNMDISKYFDWYRSMHKMLGHDKIVAVSRRQMNSKELRANNLKND